MQSQQLWPEPIQKIPFTCNQYVKDDYSILHINWWSLKRSAQRLIIRNINSSKFSFLQVGRCYLPMNQTSNPNIFNYIWSSWSILGIIVFTLFFCSVRSHSMFCGKIFSATGIQTQVKQLRRSATQLGDSWYFSLVSCLQRSQWNENQFANHVNLFKEQFMITTQSEIKYLATKELLSLVLTTKHGDRTGIRTHAPKETTHNQTRLSVYLLSCLQVPKFS